MTLPTDSNDAVQSELIQQKKLHEAAIQNYEGEDPLENWFWYFVWIEQNLPKHEQEENWTNVLQDCLTKYKDDSRYSNDLRLCKLWMKYIDTINFNDPTDSYRTLYEANICRNCAELYRGWAYYFEAAGNYQNADEVFNLGKMHLAQPMGELEAAHQAMIFAAGQQLISGIDNKRLLEERQTLTTLSTYKSEEVDSVTVGAIGGPENVPTASNNSNFAIPVHEGKLPMGAEAAPVSIISLAELGQTPTENVTNPEAWTADALNQKSTQFRRNSKFKDLVPDIVKTMGQLQKKFKECEQKIISVIDENEELAQIAEQQHKKLLDLACENSKLKKKLKQYDCEKQH